MAKKLEHSPPSECAWPGFNSWRRHHILCGSEFVVDSFLCSVRFFSGYSGSFLSPQKPTFSKFQIRPGMRKTKNHLVAVKPSSHYLLIDLYYLFIYKYDRSGV